MSAFLRATAAVVSFSILSSSLGCTLIGAGIGAAIPRASDVETPMHIEAVPRGSDVTVVYFRPFDERGGGLLQIDGTYPAKADPRAIARPAGGFREGEAGGGGVGLGRGDSGDGKRREGQHGLRLRSRRA